MIEIGPDNNANSTGYDRKFERCFTQQLAVDLDRNLGRLFDAYPAAPLFKDMPNPINSAIEQVPETEQNMPKMHWPNQRQIKHPVISYRFGQLLDTAAVVFADTDGNGQ